MADLSSVLMSGPELLSPAKFASAANSDAIALSGDGGSAEIARQFESSPFSKVFRAQLDGESKEPVHASTAAKGADTAYDGEASARLVEAIESLKRQLPPEQAGALDQWLAETPSDKILATLAKEPAFARLGGGEHEALAQSVEQLKALAIQADDKVGEVLAADDPQVAMAQLMITGEEAEAPEAGTDESEALLEQVRYLAKWRQQGDRETNAAQQVPASQGDSPDLSDEKQALNADAAIPVNEQEMDVKQTGSQKVAAESANVARASDRGDQPVQAEASDIADDAATGMDGEVVAAGNSKIQAGGTQAGGGDSKSAQSAENPGAATASTAKPAPKEQVDVEAALSEAPATDVDGELEVSMTAAAPTADKASNGATASATAAVGSVQAAARENSRQVGEQSLTSAAQPADDIKQAVESGVQQAQGGAAAQQAKEILSAAAKSEQRTVETVQETDIDADGEMADVQLRATAEAVRRQGGTPSVTTDSLLARQLAQAGAETTQANDARAEQAARQHEDRFVTELNALRSVNAQRETQTAEQPVRLSLQPGTFAPQMREKIALMVAANQQEATIQLDPEELGGMNIRVSMQADQMNVSFQVQNSQAKDLLENAMGKLKEMLAEQGIALGDSQVSQEQSSSQDGSGGDHMAGSQSMTDEEEGHQMTLTLHRQERDGIDYYA